MSIVRIHAGQGSGVPPPPPAGVTYADTFVAESTELLGGRVSRPFDGASSFTWAFVNAANGFRVQPSNSLEAVNNVFDMHYTPDDIGSDDMFVQAELTSTSPGTRWGPAIGCHLTNSSSYFLQVTNATTMLVQTFLSGSGTTTILSQPVAALSVGDIVRMEISGSNGNRLCRLLTDRGGGFVEEGSTTDTTTFAIEQRVGFHKDRGRSAAWANWKGGSL